MQKTTIRSDWTCGHCSTGRHDACRGAWIRPGKTPATLICACENHDKAPRCLECGNTRPEELTGWACTNPADCRDAIAARSAANPLRKELEQVRLLGGEARRAALHERTVNMIRRAVDESGIDRELGDDAPARRRASRPAKAPRPTTGQCICEGTNAKCANGPLPTKGGKFAPGHDASLKGALTRAVVEGDGTGEAYARMVELGWGRYAEAAQARRRKATAS